MQTLPQHLSKIKWLKVIHHRCGLCCRWAPLCVFSTCILQSPASHFYVNIWGWFFWCQLLKLILRIRIRHHINFLSWVGKKKKNQDSIFKTILGNFVCKNSYFSLWQWCVAIYCPYWFVQQNPIWCWLKVMRIAFCYIQGFGRHHIWWNLLQPQQRNTSTEGKLSISRHAVWASSPYFEEWMLLLSRTSRIRQTTNTSYLQHLENHRYSELGGTHKDCEVQPLNEWHVQEWSPQPYYLTNMTASPKSLSSPRKESPSSALFPACSPDCSWLQSWSQG